MPTDTKTRSETPAANISTNESQYHSPAEPGSSPGLPVVGPDHIGPSSVVPYQGDILADVAMTILAKQSKTRALARVISGEINELEPAEYRATIITLVKSAAGGSLDLMGQLLGARRGETLYKGGRVAESDGSFAQRLAQLIERLPAPSSTAETLVGISLRTVVRFAPTATLTQQETAIEKTIQAVRREIARTEVDRTFQVNDLWVVIRFTSQHVIDAGEPNCPFQEILLWRNGRPEPLTSNYVLKPGERLVVEPSLVVPIDIRPAGLPLAA